MALGATVIAWKKDRDGGVDQTSKQYWTRIKNAYNNNDVRQSGQFCGRSWTQLKSRWNRILPPIQNFNECYKQADKHMRNGSSDKDVDTSKKFEVKHTWLLLKDQPKFDAEFMSKCSKRTKVYASRNYSLSSNPEALTKMNNKGKESFNTLDLFDIESAMKDKNVNTSF
ncbi:hypothetical protein JHK85_057114 [Glycine max]|nr:hypothetical protein JHK85_057114 [Glycine max]